MKRVRQADDPFILARNQTKGLESRSWTRPEVGKRTPVRSWKKQPTEGIWRRATEMGSWAVDTLIIKKDCLRHEMTQRFWYCVKPTYEQTNDLEKL